MIGRKGRRGETEQRRHPVPVQEEQGQLLPQPWLVRRAVDGSYHEVKVAGKAEELLTARQVIVATGSMRARCPAWSSTESTCAINDALAIGAVPKEAGRDRLEA